MKIAFRNVRLSKDNKIRLEMINSIIEEYQAQDYRLTLRQLYYQLVSRDVIPNKQSEYSKLSTLLKEGRMGGIVDWDAIEDRLRRPDKPASWDSPSDIIDSCISQYQLPRMNGQDNYIEVWVEKDALSGVLSRVTYKYHVPIVVNRGYSSVSAMYDAYNRFIKAYRNNQKIKLLYLGDYDPSGIDMIRDIRARITEFLEGSGKWEEGDDVNEYFEVIPIALTRAQVNQYKPPPNPAKMKDPRAAGYVAKHGSKSWEVDALRPEVLNALLTKNIEMHLDMDLYQDIVDNEQEDRDKLERVKKHLK
jgi:hypothetical protein